jgi:hypothetical protein
LKVRTDTLSLSGLLSGLILTFIALLLVALSGYPPPPDPVRVEAARQRLLEYNEKQAAEHEKQAATVRRILNVAPVFR